MSAHDWITDAIAVGALALSGKQYLDGRRRSKPVVTVSDVRYIAGSPDGWTERGNEDRERVTATVSCERQVVLNQLRVVDAGRRNRPLSWGYGYRDLGADGGDAVPCLLPVGKSYIGVQLSGTDPMLHSLTNVVRLRLDLADGNAVISTIPVTVTVDQ